MDEKNLSKTLLIEDLKQSFDLFLEKRDPKELNAIWQILQHAKQKQWFNKDFYEYWLVKFLNSAYTDSAFILCVPKIAQEICGFNEKTLGEFLSPKIDFLISINEFEKVINWLTFSLEGNVFFEKAWLKNVLDFIGNESQEVFIGMNNQNEAFFLSKELKQKI